MDGEAHQAVRESNAPTGAPGSAKPRRRRALAWFLSVLATLAMIGGLAGIKVSQVRAAIAFGESFPEPSEAVIEAVAELRAIAPTATAIGELQAKRIVDLRMERGGVVRTVGFASGDAVEAGALLVQLDVAEERADLAAAKVEEGRAAQEAERQETLMAEGAGARSRLQEAEAQAAAARARVASLETAIDRKSLRAPFAGRVGITDLRPGQYVSEGHGVTRLVGLDEEIYVDFALPQAAALSFDPESPVHVAVGADDVVARVVAREPAIDAASRSLSFRAVLASADRDFPAGSLVTVTVTVGPPRDEVVVPRTALVRSPYGDTIYVLEDVDGQLRARAVIVEVGPILGADEVVIRAGLEAGARIAADGAFKLRDGALVSLGVSAS